MTGPMVIRRAARNDALHVAALMDIAGHGIDCAFWESQPDADFSLFQAARRLVIEDAAPPYHLSQAHLLEIAGEVAAGLIGGLVGGTGGAPEGSPGYLLPLYELEGLAAGFWAVIGLAVYPEFRNRGLARMLLGHALHLAAAEGAAGLSIVVEDANAPAVALYHGFGFREVERRPWQAYGERRGPQSWILLTRPF